MELVTSSTVWFVPVILAKYLNGISVLTMVSYAVRRRSERNNQPIRYDENLRRWLGWIDYLLHKYMNVMEEFERKRKLESIS
jgi:hypothetical protein